MILTRCPNCKNTVPILHPFPTDLMVQCIFCNYKDWASSFAQVEAPRQATSEQMIKKAWESISSNLNVRRLKEDVNGYIDELSKNYNLSVSTVVELINMALRYQPNQKTTPISFSVLEGEEVSLQELLERKDDYSNDGIRYVEVAGSTIELELCRNKVKKLSEDTNDREKDNFAT